jgi:hypothetical protein
VKGVLRENEKKITVSIKKVIIVLGILGAVLFLSLSFSILAGTICKKEYRKIVKLIKEIEYLKGEKKARDQRIDMMEKTMVLVYNNLSAYEAHYYSIIYDDFYQKDSVPWEAYASLARIESNFNPTVMSSARCKGIYQLKDSTAKGVAKKLDIAYNETTLWNEFLNTVLGLTYFGEGFKEKKDSLGVEEALKHAMKRYCGGPAYQIQNPESRRYVGEYKTSLWQEYTRLSYVYKGMLYDAGIRKDEDKPSYAYSFWQVYRMLH